MKKITMVLVAICFLFFANGCIAKTQDLDVGNTICPVTGDVIDPKTGVTYEYEGKVYHFCCPMCIEPFKKDPQKYIKIIEEQKKAVPAGKAHDMDKM